MKRYRQFYPIIVSDFEVKEWPHPVHNHNHYELIYIKKGKGLHYINNEPRKYHTGCAFLLGPEEEHYFKIEEQTRFIYLKFTDPYLRNVDDRPGSWIKDIDFLIKRRETRLSCIEICPEDQLIVDQIYNVISSIPRKNSGNERLIWLQLFALASIFKRNLPGLTNTRVLEKDMENMFNYIHENIYMPEKLKASHMAMQFNMATNYIGPYFKKKAGITLRAYIGKYRKTLIDHRIKSGNYSLKQIAVEFGLTDPSHVSKVLWLNKKNKSSLR